MRSQKEPEGAKMIRRSHQEEPGGGRESQEEPGGGPGRKSMKSDFSDCGIRPISVARRGQEDPEGARRSQKEPEGAKRS
jgi:hypothetical protein